VVSLGKSPINHGGDEKSGKKFGFLLLLFVVLSLEILNDVCFAPFQTFSQ
jgi:hypothetical protein